MPSKVENQQRNKCRHVEQHEARGNIGLKMSIAIQTARDKYRKQKENRISIIIY